MCTFISVNITLHTHVHAHFSCIVGKLSGPAGHACGIDHEHRSQNDNCRASDDMYTSYQLTVLSVVFDQCPPLSPPSSSLSTSLPLPPSLPPSPSLLLSLYLTPPLPPSLPPSPSLSYTEHWSGFQSCSNCIAESSYERSVKFLTFLSCVVMLLSAISLLATAVVTGWIQAEH